MYCIGTSVWSFSNLVFASCTHTVYRQMETPMQQSMYSPTKVLGPTLHHSQGWGIPVQGVTWDLCPSRLGVGGILNFWRPEMATSQSPHIPIMMPSLSGMGGLQPNYVPGGAPFCGFCRPQVSMSPQVHTVGCLRGLYIIIKAHISVRGKCVLQSTKVHLSHDL